MHLPSELFFFGLAVLTVVFILASRRDARLHGRLAASIRLAEADEATRAKREENKAKTLELVSQVLPVGIQMFQETFKKPSAPPTDWRKSGREIMADDAVAALCKLTQDEVEKIAAALGGERAAVFYSAVSAAHIAHDYRAKGTPAPSASA